MTELIIPWVMETDEGEDVVCDGHLDPQPFVRAMLACGVFEGWIDDPAGFDEKALLAHVEHRWWLPDPSDDEIGKFCDPDTAGARPITLITDYHEHFLVSSGADLITVERRRQILAEGFSAEHDAEHDLAELTAASICYSLQALWQQTDGNVEVDPTRFWPWGTESWKPSSDVERNLAKAGALLAAEIDRWEAL